jgi:hypothetical protein
MSQICFFVLELIEVYHDIKDYVRSINNWIEFGVVIVSVFYFGLRLQHIDKNYYPLGERPNNDDPHFVTIILLNLIIFSAAIAKILKFFKIFEDFAILVQLLVKSFKDVYIFTLFMFLMLLFISELYFVIGAEYEVDDYPEIDKNA